MKAMCLFVLAGVGLPISSLAAKEVHHEARDVDGSPSFIPRSGPRDVQASRIETCNLMARRRNKSCDA